jgi:hypothetical protein
MSTHTETTTCETCGYVVDDDGDCLREGETGEQCPSYVHPDRIEQQIAEAAAGANFGEPTAAKRGRNPRWPYVPVIRYTPPEGKSYTTQLRKRAFATRDEAETFAQDHIASARQSLARQLADPRCRVLREHYGLPTEIDQP